MKICVISAILPPYTRGGAEGVAGAALQAFPEHEVFAISAEPWRSWRSLFGHWDKIDGEEDRTFKVFRFTPLNIFSIFYIAQHRAITRLFWHGLDMFNLHTYFMVRSILRREKPDLILTHNLKGLGYTVPLAIRHSASDKYRPRWFHTIHDMGALHPTGLKIYGQENSFAQTMPLVRIYARLNARLFGSPDIVISPSEFLLEEYQRSGFFAKSKTAVIRNPVLSQAIPAADKKLPPLFHPRASLAKPDGSPRWGYGEAGAVFRFLYLGQLEPYKGIGLLLEVWETFALSRDDAELHIAGEGGLRREVERAVGLVPRIRYYGFLDKERMDSLLSRSHFLVLPSLAYENSPTVIGQSFTAGVPVIASKIGGIPELIKGGVNGFLFQPADASALLGVLEKVVSVDYEKLRQGALRNAPNFSLKKYHDQVIRLFRCEK